MSLQALQGIRVLDLSHVIAGPTASHYLALEGAEVIKVETPSRGDILRHSRQGEQLDQGVSVGFAAINGGKKSLAIDLKQPQAKALLARLVAQCDVFIENFRPGAIARLGFDEATVRALQPHIVYVSISGFGQQGEWATRAAYDHVVQSAMGMGWLQGEAGHDPVKVGFPVIDSATGMLAAQSIMAALLRRFRTGQGATLDVSMAQAALQLMWPEVAKVAASGQDTPRVGNRGFSGSPGAATFACADGWISVAANTAAQLRVLCQVLQLPDILQSAEWIDQEALQRGGFVVARAPEPIHQMLSQAIRQQNAQDLEQALSAQGVPCARLRPLSEVLPDVMNHARMSLPLSQTPYPGGTLHTMGAGYVAPQEPGQALAPAPRLGQHTREILQSLQLGNAEIEALAKQGLVRLGD